jgi:putrescine transport system ATP-binding protein
MNVGVLAQVDTPADIYENPKSKFVADFIGDVNMIEGSISKLQSKAGDEFIEFTSDTGSKLMARSESDCKIGDKASLAVRPEKITISKQRDPKAENQVTGKVDDIAYIGNLSTYYVRLENGTIIKAQEANRRRISNREISWEDDVWLSWTPGGGVILTR